MCIIKTFQIIWRALYTNAQWISLNLPSSENDCAQYKIQSKSSVDSLKCSDFPLGQMQIQMIPKIVNVALMMDGMDFALINMLNDNTFGAWLRKSYKKICNVLYQQNGYYTLRKTCSHSFGGGHFFAASFFSVLFITYCLRLLLLLLLFLPMTIPVHCVYFLFLYCWFSQCTNDGRKVLHDRLFTVMSSYKRERLNFNLLFVPSHSLCVCVSTSNYIIVVNCVHLWQSIIRQ